MKPLPLLVLSAAMAALSALAPAEAGAQQRPVGGVPRNNFSSGGGFHSGGMHGGRIHGLGGGVWVVEREVEVPVYVEVPTPPPPAAVPLPEQAQGGEKRKPYVIGASYDSLPGGCMKLIEEGVSFFYCSGEWYQEVRAGRNPLYRAVARKL